MKRDLVFTRLYPHPPELVWHALTDSAAIAEWLMENNFELRVDHCFQFRTDPAPGFDGIVNCRVLEVLERQRLSYTWRGGPIDTVITFTLEAAGEGTRLTVRQSGFKGLKAVLVSYILQRGIPGIYDRKLPALLERLRAGAVRPDEGAVRSDVTSCEAEGWDSLGTRLLIHAANIAPGSRPASEHPAPTDDTQHTNNDSADTMGRS